jgi:hypothetical protein
MGGSNKFFIEPYCSGRKRVAQRELLNAPHFLAAKRGAKSEQILTKIDEQLGGALTKG